MIYRLAALPNSNIQEFLERMAAKKIVFSSASALRDGPELPNFGLKNRVA
jgi:hypothetical protein